MSATFLTTAATRTADAASPCTAAVTLPHLVLHDVLRELELEKYVDAFVTASIGDEELNRVFGQQSEEAVNALIKAVGLRGGSATKLRRRLTKPVNARSGGDEPKAKSRHQRQRQAQPPQEDASSTSSSLLMSGGHFVVTSQSDLAWVFEQAQQCTIASGIVVVEFKARWCGGCTRFAPTYSKLAVDLQSTYLCVADVDDAPELAEAHGASQLPLFVIYRDGKRWDQLVGGKQTVLRQKVLAAIDGKVHKV